MKIGIYNRYWNTFGGGENYTGSIAQILSDEHKVELISVEPVDWSVLQARLRLDLSRCTTKQWPNDSCEKLSVFSADYDLFINSTYGSSITPLSKNSVLICYFPHRIDRLTKLRSALSRLITDLSNNRFRWPVIVRRKLPDIVAISGSYDREPDGRCWIGASTLLSVMPTIADNIQIGLWPGAYCGITSVTINCVPCAYKISDNQLLIQHTGSKKERINIVISSTTITPSNKGISLDGRQLGACIDTRKTSWVNHPNFVSMLSSTEAEKSVLSRYSKIISISQFTTEWINKRWNLPSYELQPPIDTDVFNCDLSTPREHLVLSVGRFFAGGHNKKHHEMARAFIRMRKEGYIPDGWRLALVGARHREHPRHISYFEELKKLCEGHPIEIRTDLPFNELLEYYQRASIYLHAAGWGENVNTNPERFEHFGMTTCEAMACGCVPLAFSGAGQKEIIKDDETGYLFRDYAMLARRTRELITAHEIGGLMQMRKNARDSIAKYARRSFPERVKAAFKRVAY